MRSPNMKQSIVTLVSIAAIVSTVFAHGGNPHVMGTVTSIDEKTIEVKTEEGKTVSAHLTKETKYTKGDKAATRADVKVGMRAVLHLEGKGEHQTVHEVKLAADE